ncbi:MAG: hypothetical protein PHU98_06155 [Mariniphaga sp.]|nr:hypothetical protein [Paludibacter sp.]MDD4225953.1 hypothetical protein [Mariniphaga sp.]
MSSFINNGIKQPLRFYDSVTKQNYRSAWVSKQNGGFDEFEVLICPENAIVPFQVRRMASPLPVSVFNIYNIVAGTWTFYLDLFTIIPAPTTNHLSIVQCGPVDNIIWNPLADFTTPLPCGFYYVEVGDGVTTFYSEVFRVIADFTVSVQNKLKLLDDPTVTGGNYYKPSATDTYIQQKKPF